MERHASLNGLDFEKIEFFLSSRANDNGQMWLLCACHPENAGRSEAGDCRRGSGGRKYKRVVGGGLASRSEKANTAQKATVNLRRGVWTVHSVMLGMKFSESVPVDNKTLLSELC
jgi:hypothetical protein